MKTEDRLEPKVFAIFSGARDLTWRKLEPALFYLSQDRSLPTELTQYGHKVRGATPSKKSK